jgi:hypothetical protein
MEEVVFYFTAHTVLFNSEERYNTVLLTSDMFGFMSVKSCSLPSSAQFTTNLCLPDVLFRLWGPTQTPVKWVPGGPFPGAKPRPGRDANHSPLCICRGRL